MEKETVEAAIAAAASKTTYTGAGTAAVGWLMSSEFAVLSGLAFALIGVAVNWYYKAKADRRYALEHALRVELLRRGEWPEEGPGGLE